MKTVMVYHTTVKEHLVGDHWSSLSRYNTTLGPRAIQHSEDDLLDAGSLDYQEVKVERMPIVCHKEYDRGRLNTFYTCMDSKTRYIVGLQEGRTNDILNELNGIYKLTFWQRLKKVFSGF